jgi:phasin family protein
MTETVKARGEPACKPAKLAPLLPPYAACAPIESLLPEFTHHGGAQSCEKPKQNAPASGKTYFAAVHNFYCNSSILRAVHIDYPTLKENTMSLNVEQFAAANKATVDSLLAVANTALASAERIAALNLNTARSALEDTASGVQTVLSAKDPQAALAAQKSLAQPAVDKAVAYGKSVFEITSQTQQELAKMVEAQFSDFQKSIAGMVEMAAKSAPAGSEGAVAAIQNAIAAANSAFGNMNAVTKQFTDAAQANIAAMTKR